MEENVAGSDLVKYRKEIKKLVEVEGGGCIENKDCYEGFDFERLCEAAEVLSQREF